MTNEDMKKCPYCAEMIKAEAVRCRYCNSNLKNKGAVMDFLTTPGYWQRVWEGKKIAGVCTGIARQLDSPILIMPLRLFFIITTIFYGFGLILYIILWLLMPPPTDIPGAAGQPKTTATDTEADSEPGPTEETGEGESSFDEIVIGDESSEQPEPEETPGEQKKSEEGTASEHRMMTPLFGTGAVILCLFLAVGMYMSALESFIGVTLPPALIVFGFIAVISIAVVAVRELVYKNRMAVLRSV